MEYSNEAKVLLLKIIKFNGDLTPMNKLGFEYSQIADLIDEEVRLGNIQFQNDVIFVTEQGNGIIEQLTGNRKGGSEKWIEPELESKMAKFSKDFIYLPNRKELSF